jgi:hypothetical protein
MTDDELRKLAEEALADDAKATPGPWRFEDDGTLGGSLLHAEGGWPPAFPGDRRPLWVPPPDGPFIAAARTREPELARAVLRLLEERDDLARYKRAAEVMLADWETSDDVQVRDVGHFLRIDLARRLESP